MGVLKFSFSTVKCENVFCFMKLQHLEYVKICKFKPYDCIFAHPETIKVINKNSISFLKYFNTKLRISSYIEKDDFN